jgi:TorA maturation chaperone TorD
VIPTPWIERAAIWRFTSLLFQSPSKESAADLAALAAEMPKNLRARARRLAAYSAHDREVDYHRYLGPGGIPASESSFDESALAGRGPAIAAIVAYYEAFAYRPVREGMEIADHVSVELGFLSYLALKIAFGFHQGDEEKSETARAAYRRFLQEHALFWFPRFIERMKETDSKFYHDAARWLREVSAACCTEINL